MLPSEMTAIEFRKFMNLVPSIITYQQLLSIGNDCYTYISNNGLIITEFYDEGIADVSDWFLYNQVSTWPSNNYPCFEFFDEWILPNEDSGYTTPEPILSDNDLFFVYEELRRVT